MTSGTSIGLLSFATSLTSTATSSLPSRRSRLDWSLAICRFLSHWMHYELKSYFPPPRLKSLHWRSQNSIGRERAKVYRTVFETSILYTNWNPSCRHFCSSNLAVSYSIPPRDRGLYSATHWEGFVPISWFHPRVAWFDRGHWRRFQRYSLEAQRRCTNGGTTWWMVDLIVFIGLSSRRRGGATTMGGVGCSALK